jgi:hypothetical protein
MKAGAGSTPAATQTGAGEMQQAPTYADFDRLYAATLESIARWNEAERELAQARQDMARDVRVLIEEKTQ